MVGRKKVHNGDLLSSEKRCLNEFKELVEVDNWLQFKKKDYNENMFFMFVTSEVSKLLRSRLVSEAQL